MNILEEYAKSQIAAFEWNKKNDPVYIKHFKENKNDEQYFIDDRNYELENEILEEKRNDNDIIADNNYDYIRRGE